MKADEHMADINQEIEAYNQRKAELEANHMGKWVLIHDLELIGIFDSIEAAADAAVQRFGRGPYLIRQIGAPPVTLPASYMYHPV
jgi:hypothetical protein